MMWLQILSFTTSILAMLICACKKEWVEWTFEILVVLSVVLYVLAAFTYSEPQAIQETAVHLGVGKFIADEKGKVDFYFIVNGKEIKYEGRLHSK